MVYALVGTANAERFAGQWLRSSMATSLAFFATLTAPKVVNLGNRAKQFTSELIFGRTIDVDIREVDRYGRLVSRVVVTGAT